MATQLFRRDRLAPPPPPALHPLEAGLPPKPEKRAAARERGLQLEDAVDDDATEGEPQISKTAASASPPQPSRPKSAPLLAGAQI